MKGNTDCKCKKSIIIDECEELARSQEVLNTILESINEGILAIDNSGNILHSNKRFKEMWKIPDEIFSAAYWDKILSSMKDQLKDPDNFTSKIIRLIDTTEESLDIIEFKDTRVYQLLTRPLLINNSIKGRVWSFKDITRFKKNEKELKDKIAFQHKFINTIPNPVFIKDKSGNYIDCNTAYEKFLGISKFEILGKGVHDIFPKKLADKYYIMDNKLFQSKGTQVYEHSITHADGTFHEVSFSKATFTDAEGSVAGLVGVFSDITEKKKIAKALCESEERYRNLFENSPYSIIVHSEGRIIFANQPAAKLVGLSSSDELIGRKVMDFVHPDYHKIVQERINLVQTYKKYLPSIEEKFLKLDGTSIDVEAATTYFLYEGKIASQVVVKDITQRKKEEKLRKQTENKLNEAIEHNKLITEFFANISHEFKTPLNIILGTFQLLIMTLKEEKAENQPLDYYKKIKIMQQNCYRLLRLVNNLIDITKIDSGYFILNPTNHNIISFIENVTLSVAEYIQDKDIGLTFDTNVEEEIMAFDPDGIERIMLNLLSNSVKFTNSGGTIEVVVESKDRNLIVSVKDSGIGIPEEKKDIVFDRFRQVDKLLTRNHEGSGIGLSLVRSLVEMHDGEISIESNESSGTEFILTFPIKILEESNVTYIKDIDFHQDCVERINIEFSDIYS